MPRMQEKIPSERAVPNSTRDLLHDLPTKDEEPYDESLEEGIEMVGEPLDKDDYELCEKGKEKAVKRRCRFCWCTLIALFTYLLSDFYFKKIFTVYL
tara:strand:- start:953 stop:1243 length:291 start_codon:yes stop_codon:yes gene_type:complete